MGLLDHFRHFVKEKALIQEGARVLLAISGGVDSMVLANLLLQSEIEFGVAHCNFQLRGVESDEDEFFVRDWAKTNQIPFYITRFQTEALAQKRKTSIQLLARELRYEWLENIRQQQFFTSISTAHHLNDSLETFLYNFTKGAGLAGMRGVPLRNEKIIRPLLFASKEAILSFAKEEGINYREDSSNPTGKYARNKIRHHVVPILKKINPSLEDTAARNFNILHQSYLLLQERVEQFKVDWVEEIEGQIHISLAGLHENPLTQQTLLFECIRHAGFHYRQIEQLLLQLSKRRVGAIYYSMSHRLLVDRDALILDQLETVDDTCNSILISKETEMIALSNGMLIFDVKNGKPDSFGSPDQSALLDADTLMYPLQLRKWKAGDVFCPLGMNGQHQKLQDFFSNNGLSRFEKEKVWLLVDAKDNIVWIVGYRIDDRNKINANTNSFLDITYVKDSL